METNEIEAMFKHLGLTQYESKALITLLSFGKCTADKVASLSNIPLPRVYDTMGALAKKGFISVSKSRPEVFKAVDPKRLFDILADDERKKADTRINELKQVMPEILKQIKKFDNVEEESEELLALVKKRVNMRKDREYFHSVAKREIFVFAGDMSWIRHTEDIIKGATRRKVNYCVLFCKKNVASLRNAKRFKRIGAKVRYFPDLGDLRGIIVDGEIISLVLKKFKGAEESEYSVININNKLIGDVFRRYFVSLWDKAERI